MVKQGERIRVLPSGLESTGTRIVTMDGDLDHAIAGQAITLTLADEIDISRGDVIARPDDLPGVADQFEAVVVWMSDEPMLPGRPYWLKIGTKQVAATITEPKYKVFITVLRLSGTCIAMIVSFVIAGVIANPNAASASQSAEETAQAGIALLVVSIINALLLAYPISRSRWHGLKLVGAVLLVFFGVQTFMSQIETIFFGSAFNISATEMTSIVLTGFLTAVFFSFLAVLILGKMRKPKEDEMPASPLGLSMQGWIMRLALLPLAYIVIYFLFGYFIARQSSDVRELYTGRARSITSSCSGQICRSSLFSRASRNCSVRLD